MKKENIIVDGANVAYERMGKKEIPLVSNIILVRKKLMDMGYDPTIIVDASMRHKVKDKKQFQGLIDKEKVVQVPANTDADYFILKLAEERDKKIVTNDTYSEYKEEFPSIAERRVPFKIVDSDVIFYKLKDLKS